MQSRADEAYQTARRRAPPPLPYESPEQYRIRLIDGVKGYSPAWKRADLSKTAISGALDVAEQQIFADAKKYGRTADLKPYEILERLVTTPAGAKVIEFDGGEHAHFTNQFSRAAKVTYMPSRQEAELMEQKSILARITERVSGWARPMVGAPRASF
jgi:hypothetical protein